MQIEASKSLVSKELFEKELQKLKLEQSKLESVIEDLRIANDELQ
jgi:hypothetical protein